jgi:hypothetical protein
VLVRALLYTFNCRRVCNAFNPSNDDILLNDISRERKFVNDSNAAGSWARPWL